jgi:thiamine-phosphate pyrophosphorylase
VARLTDMARRLNLSAGVAGAPPAYHIRGHPVAPGVVKRRLPPLILMTDTARLADPEAAIAGLPRGSAVILRHYDDPGREALGRRLRTLSRGAGVLLLVAGDARLAARLRADGLHLPEWMVRRAAGRRWPRPGWLVTAAAHSPAALWRAQRAGADAALLSPIFATASHPGAKPLGVLRFAAWCRAAPLPTYALGGITAETGRRLATSLAAGLAATGGVKTGAG